ncbi:hypothetical protein ACS0TY_004271 [Phlomoides rotata]
MGAVNLAEKDQNLGRECKEENSKSVKCRCVLVRVLLTWEARNFKRNKDLMSVDFLLLDENAVGWFLSASFWTEIALYFWDSMLFKESCCQFFSDLGFECSKLLHFLFSGRTLASSLLNSSLDLNARPLSLFSSLTLFITHKLKLILQGFHPYKDLRNPSSSHRVITLQSSKKVAVKFSQIWVLSVLSRFTFCFLVELWPDLGSLEQFCERFFELFQAVL